MALKVFNWLNRKMHSNVEYCTIDENKAMEKEDCVRESVAEQDTESLLLRDMLLNGILAIGTLGHSVNSFCPEACHEQDEFVIMDQGKVEQDKYEEEKCENEEDASATAPSEAEPAAEPDKMHLSSMKEYSFTCSVKEQILMHEVEAEDVAKIQERPLLMAENVEKVRTTLADLFAAEAFSSNDTGEKSYQKTVIITGASTIKAYITSGKDASKKANKANARSTEGYKKIKSGHEEDVGEEDPPRAAQ